jgi:hypothetical protein
MLAKEMIYGIAHCPLCKKPAVCHNQPVSYRALYWALSGDTGNSSEALARHMVFGAGGNPPSDADDRSRCIRLLELIPEWLPRLKEMIKYDAPAKKQDGIVINSSGISAYDNSWSKQIPLIVSEGNFARPS